MNVLLVDDEPLIIQDMLSSVSWDSLGVSQVLTAYSASEAMSELKSYHVDLIICDIEMPKTNGLQLLSWVKEHFPSIRSIILTCHPLFDYAQEALRLNCIDYLLKPVDTDELEALLKNAAGTLHQTSLLYDTEFFWKQCVNGSYADHATLRKAAEKCGLSSPDSVYLTLMIRPVCAEESFSAENFSLSVLDAVTFVFSDLNSEHYIFPDHTHALFGIFHTSADEASLLAGLICQKLMELRYSISAAACAFLRQSAGIISTVHSFSLLRDYSNQAKTSCIQFLSSASMPPKHYFPSLHHPHMRIQEDMIIREIKKQLASLPSKFSRCQDTIIPMRSEVEDWFFTILADLKCSPCDAILESDILCLREQALSGPEDFLVWVRALLSVIIRQNRRCRQFSPAVIQAQEYINQNLHLNLSRKEIASKVFLNADYLDRCFKNELGLSISQYVLKKKLDTAKELLTNTQKSISDIAASIGYYNLSSFSYMFKHETGQTPMSYRRSYNR